MTETMTLALAEMQRDRAEAELVHMDNLLRRVLREAHPSRDLATLIESVLAAHAKDIMIEPEDRALCRAPARKVTNPKEVLDLWGQGCTGARPDVLQIAPSALHLLRQAGCLTAEGNVTKRGEDVRQALDLYEACLFAKGCDDTAETDEGVRAAFLRGLIRSYPRTDAYELTLTPEGEALVEAVGAAKARAAQEGAVVWPGAAVDVVLAWPAGPPGQSKDGDITIPGSAARPAMTVGMGVVLGLYRAAVARGDGILLTRGDWAPIHCSDELVVVLVGPDTVAVRVPDATWCALGEAQ